MELKEIEKLNTKNLYKLLCDIKSIYYKRVCKDNIESFKKFKSKIKVGDIIDKDTSNFSAEKEVLTVTKITDKKLSYRCEITTIDNDLFITNDLSIDNYISTVHRKNKLIWKANR